MVSMVVCFLIFMTTKDLREVISTNTSLESVGKSRRPFYLFAHMVNSVTEIHDYMYQGANAIEVDVNFDKNTGYPTDMYHGPPNLCGRDSLQREHVVRYINYMRLLTTPGADIYLDGLCMLYCDLKFGGIKSLQVQRYAGRHFASLLIKDLYLNESTPKTGLKLIIEVPPSLLTSFVEEFVKTFKESNNSELLDKYIGWNFGQSIDSSEDLNLLVKIFGITNIWLSDGDFHCERPIKGPRIHLKKIVELRDTPGTVASKAIGWTLDIESVVKDTLRFNVDSIITNRPDTVLKLLQSPEFEPLYRIANVNDDPWQKYIYH